MEFTTASFDGFDEYPIDIANKIEFLGEYYFQICEDENFVESEPHTQDYFEIMSTCGNVLIQAVKILPRYYPMVEIAYEATLTYYGFADQLVGANLEGVLDEWAMNNVVPS